MKRFRLLALIPVVAVLGVLTGAPSRTHAVPPTPPAAPYYAEQTIHLPPSLYDLTSFDIGFVDPSTDTYVFTDRDNLGLDVFDANANRFIRNIKGFCGNVPRRTGTVPPLPAAPAGCTTSGPNGVFIVSADGQDHGDPDGGDSNHGHHGVGDRVNLGIAWAGDGDSSVKVVNLNTGAILHTIPTGGTGRADEGAYDPRDHIVVFANDQNNPPFLTFINSQTYAVVGTISFDGSSGAHHGPLAVVGGAPAMEQAAFDRTTGHFWISVPGTSTTTAWTGNPGGEIDEVDPIAETVLTRIAVGSAATPCGPTGLALGPHHQAFAPCGNVNSGDVIVDLTAHTVLATIPEAAGGDEAWFNRGDGHYYTASARPYTATGFTYPTNHSAVFVVDANSHAFLGWIDLGVSGGTDHSVAVNENNNEIFAPHGIRFTSGTSPTAIQNLLCLVPATCLQPASPTTGVHVIVHTP